MANRYWAAGVSGNWNSTSSWSTSATGTPAGASVPGSSDAALFNAASGVVTATLDISPDIQTLTMTGFTGTLAFGTNTISLNSTGTVYAGTLTMTVTGTPQIILTNNSATARTVSPAAVTEANSISFQIIAGTGTLALTSGSYRNLDFTDGINPTGYAGALGNNSNTIYGNLKASTGMTRTAGTAGYTFAATSGTKTINTAGVTFDCPFVFSGIGGTWQLQAALTSGATRQSTLTSGTLDLNGYTYTAGIFNTSNSNTRTLAFGAGKIVVIGNATTIWTNSTATGLTVTGTAPLVQSTYSGSTGTRSITMGAAGEANAISVEVTAGSDTVAFGTTTGAFKNVNFTGFTGIYSQTNSIQCYGSWNFGGVTSVTGTSVVTFSATSGTNTITSSGRTFSGSVTFNGVGSTWSLADAFGCNILTLTTGIITTNGYSVTCSSISSTNSNARTFNLGASTVTLTGSGTPLNFTDPTNLTFNAGTSNIVFNNTTGTLSIVTGGKTFYNVALPESAYRVLFSGTATVNQLTASNIAVVGTKRIVLDTGQTYGTLIGTGANGNCRVIFICGILGTQANITASSVSFVDVDFRDINALGAAIPWTGTRLGNIGNNTNITFAAGKTVYWNKVLGGSWGNDAWATASGGATSTLNQPLGQDSAIFDDTGLNASSTVIFGNYYSGGLDCSVLTNALIIQTDSTYNEPMFGKDVVLSSAVSFTGTANMAFDGRLGTQYVTSAGVNWSCGISPQASSTLVLVDNLSTDDVSFTLGPFDLNGKTLTCNVFTGSGTLTRSIIFNSGQINVAGSSASVWNCADLTGFSYTGTPTVNFTYSGSIGARVVANGSIGLTEANAVDFNIVAGGDSWSTSGAPVGVRNITFQPAFTGSATLFGNGFIYGNVLLSPSQTIAASTAITTFAATSGVKTINTNGVAIDRNVAFSGIGGTWSLQSAFTTAYEKTISFLAGTLTTNGYAVTCGKFGNDPLLAVGNRTVNFGSSSITLLGTSTTNSSLQIENGSFAFTINAGTSTIYMAETFTGTSSQDFIGGGKSYYNVVYSGGQASAIYNSNTFNSISNTTQPLALSFVAGTTQTVNNFNVSGTAGNLVTMTSVTPGTQWGLSKNTGSGVLVSFCSITDSAASPAGYWFAPTTQGNVNGGNNTGWNFATAGNPSGFLSFL